MVVKSLVRNDYNVYAYNNCEDVRSLISNNRMDVFLVKLDESSTIKMVLRQQLSTLSNELTHLSQWVSFFARKNNVKAQKF